MTEKNILLKSTELTSLYSTIKEASSGVKSIADKKICVALTQIHLLNKMLEIYDSALRAEAVRRNLPEYVDRNHFLEMKIVKGNDSTEYDIENLFNAFKADPTTDIKEFFKIVNVVQKRVETELSKELQDLVQKHAVKKISNKKIVAIRALNKSAKVKLLDRNAPKSAKKLNKK